MRNEFKVKDELGWFEITAIVIALFLAGIGAYSVLTV